MNIPTHLVDRIHLVNLNGQCNVNIYLPYIECLGYFPF